MPLCWECYDYTGHVLWQWHAPELFRRFTITLQRRMARVRGMSVRDFRERVKISYSKIVEFQARGIVHFHIPIRLDGPEGPEGPGPALDLSTGDLEDAVRYAARTTRLDTPPLADETVHRLRFGEQVDCHAITPDADRDSEHGSGVVHPEQVAAYLAKYLTKTTEEFGLPSRVRSSIHARFAGANPHVVRIIETAEKLAGQHISFARLSERYTTLGYRGHPITKSRSFSITFGQIRRSRRIFKANPGLDPDADVRELLDEEDVPEGFELISSWVYAGRGYLSMDQAADAVRSAALSRTRRRVSVPSMRITTT